MTIETYEPYGVPDVFCEALLRVDRIGSCRRLVFVVNDRGDPGNAARAIVAKLVIPAELMADLAQVIAADRPEPDTVFLRLPVNAVAH